MAPEFDTLQREYDNRLPDEPRTLSEEEWEAVQALERLLERRCNDTFMPGEVREMVEGWMGELQSWMGV